MQILLDTPWYCVPLCLMAGALWAGLLYAFPGRAAVGGPRLRRWLAGLRFVGVSLIAFLLTAPMTKRQTAEREKPIVVMALDRSESTAGLLPEWVSDPCGLDDYEVVADTFGGRSTDIGAELRSIAERYAGRNLGAVVLVSDGIYNQGANPLGEAARMAVPVYAVGLGDTAHRCDAAIVHVRCNHTAYLGDRFPAEVTLRADRLKGCRPVLTVTRDGKRLFVQEMPIGSDDFSATVPLTLESDKPGLHHYVIALTPQPGERTAENNRVTLAVEVADGREKIAILSAAPTPDAGALRRALERNPNYEVSVLGGEESLRADAYSLIVLIGLPDGRRECATGETPTLYVLGPTTDLGRFNALRCGLEIAAKTRKTDEVTAVHNDHFTLFGLDDEYCRLIEQLPPLRAPFGEYRLAGSGQSLFTARIGSVSTERPLVAFVQQNGVRRAFVTGEGLWRWRLQCFQMTGSHEAFDRLVEKMVVYTSMRDAKERFRVTVPRIIAEGDNVVAEAELYNDNLEPVNKPDARLTLAAERQPGRAYEFGRRGTGYVLNLGSLPPGRYRYEAETRMAGTRFEAAGSFVVEDANLEQATLVADHALLEAIAQSTGGELLPPDGEKRLAESLASRGDLKPLLSSHYRYTELLTLPLLLVLLLLLLGAEWGLRKWAGDC